MLRYKHDTTHKQSKYNNEISIGENVGIGITSTETFYTFLVIRAGKILGSVLLTQGQSEILNKINEDIGYVQI